MRFNADEWCERARTEIQHWLRNKVRPLYFNGNGVDAGDQAEALTISARSISTMCSSETSSREKGGPSYVGSRAGTVKSGIINHF